MILKREIEQAALKQEVAKGTIDKDWVLGHFIDAIFSIPDCREQLVFKGGTCLRKCYFADYRFSEDLDFTAIGEHFVLDRKLLSLIVKLVNERTEIPLYIHELKPLLHNNMQMGFAAYVKFWGADHIRNQAPPAPNRWQTGIKIEITSFESVVFKTVQKPVFHPYSDRLTAAANDIPCYGLYEVLAEKLRALIQRSCTAPRDYFDIWYLKNNLKNIDWPIVVNAFFEKMKFKNLEFTGIDQLINPNSEKQLLAAWDNSLAHQIKRDLLPTFEQLKTELTELFTEIFQ